MQNKGPKKVDLFRLISMRGARIWPQNGREPGFLCDFNKSTQQMTNKVSPKRYRFISTNFDAGSSNPASGRRETAGNPIFHQNVKNKRKERNRAFTS